MRPGQTTRRVSDHGYFNAHGTPWILRPVTGRVELKVPPGQMDRRWLRTGFDSGQRLLEVLVKPANSWLIAREHFALAASAMAEKFGSVDVYMRFKSEERCSDRCVGAKLDECVCSCLGMNHGGGLYTSVGWVNQGERPLGNGEVEVHLVLPAGQSLPTLTRQ